MTIAEGRKTYHGVNGILNRDRIICDPHLGLGRCATIIRPCSCIYLRNNMYLTWYPYIVPKDQPICFSVTTCKYYIILVKHNYREIMDFVDKGIY